LPWTQEYFLFRAQGALAMSLDNLISLLKIIALTSTLQRTTNEQSYALPNRKPLYDWRLKCTYTFL